MNAYNLVTLSLLICTVRCDDSVRPIPKEFLLGAGTSAYQYEGAWNEDGRGPSIWDTEIHQKESRIIDGSNADIAADGYHRYKEDVQLMKNISLDFFRFSISWSRILPTGYANNINQLGIDYYNNFIDELLKNNIKPLVTIFQIDMPQKLQEYGGWTNSIIVDFYLDYVKVVFDNFGDRVKFWVTINEPIFFCYYSAGLNRFAPFLNLSGIGDYMCIKNTLIAHARAYRLYDQYYRKQQKGEVGFSLFYYWYKPYTNSTDDIEAAEDCANFSVGMFLNPILSEAGDFPVVVKRRVAVKSSEEGFSRSRLPTLTQIEIDMIKGATDFVGFNIYATTEVYRNSSIIGTFDVPSAKGDNFYKSISDGSKSVANVTLKSTPWAAYKSLMKIKEQYNNPAIYITENGYVQAGLDDFDRIQYINDYLNAFIDAKEDGCDIRGYSYWSFMDSFEFVHGYQRKMGLYEIDYSGLNLTRIAKKSAHYYKNLTTTRTLHRKITL